MVDADVVARLVDHLRHDTTDLAADDLFVPVAHFTDPARAQAEIALLKRLPLFVAHRSELPNAGDFVTRELLGMPLIVARQSDGGVRAYLNMCRHRGGRVEPETSGNKRVFMCRYHGWSYERDGGGLRHVPYENSFGPIERATQGLTPFRAEERHGLIYVDLSNDARRSLADWFGTDVDAQIAPWRLQDSQIVIDKTFTMDINWKLVMDGAIDIIHPRFLHQNGVGKLIETNVGVFKDFGRHGKHFGARSRLRSMARDGGALDGGSKYIGSNLVLYPNAMMIGAPEHVEFWTVWPALDSAARCTVQIRFLVRSEILDEHIEKRVHKSWEILEQAAMQEDWPMERWIQQNAEAWPHGSFRYGRSELACAHLHRQLARDLDGAR
ncbi:aromatic ring-hydroxylating oxygenase subunit alpha [Solimonas soli]|uniref:aromatic ring-hydroxylating oxygenase subunit alpha n=1 Tax=Solimonas soli TaxID=413479 RepID=UPI0004BA9787|nr:aromatic ring-hydroxylating dioxygenase subunit alpha [Solimonas soli]